MENNVIVEYILVQEKFHQEHLWEIYKIIDELIGEKTTKIISYQMPTFKAKRNVIHFAAFTNHVGVYPGSAAIEHFKDEIGNYKFSKGTLQIKYTDQVPIELIKKMTLYTYELNKK